MILNSFEIHVLNKEKEIYHSGAKTLSQAVEIYSQCIRKYFSNFETNKIQILGNYVMNIYSDEYIKRMQRSMENPKKVFEKISNINTTYKKGHMTITLVHSSKILK